MEIHKRVLGKFRKTINPPYGLHDIPSLLGIILLFVSLLLLAVLIAQPTEPRSIASGDVGQTNVSEFSSNEILVKVKKEPAKKINSKARPENIGVSSIEKINKDFKVEEFKKVLPDDKDAKTDQSLFDWYEVKIPGVEKKIKGTYNKDTKKLSSSDPSSNSVKRLIDKYHADPNIETVEPNFVVRALVTPNDPYYSSTGSWGQSYKDLWGIHKIDAKLAWNQTTGSGSVIVANIDTGVDRNHEDLQSNMWTNSAEIPNNGVDDDSNGYIDDYHGWDWVNNDNDPMDDHGHGTHTAGTIAAVGNNATGVVGVNWTSKIMALKFLSSGGSGSLSNAVKALQYAADNGAKVSSNSWGCFCNSFFMDDAIKYEHDAGMAVAVAAGNSNWDALDFSPASSDYSITVAATSSTDSKASFSNYGEKIDVAAPGVDVLSLKASVSPMCSSSRTVGTKYCRVSGTSMAAPHVAGLAALLWANNASLSNEEIRQILRSGADDLGTSGKDIFFGYGRINADGSMKLSSSGYLAPVITSPRGRGSASGSNYNVTGGVPGPKFANYKLEAGRGRNPASWTTLKNSTSQVVSGTLATVDTTLLSDGDYIFRLTATATDGKKYKFQVHDVDVNNGNPPDTLPPSAPTGLKARIVSSSRVDLTWNASTDNVAVAGYRVYRNGVLRKTQTGRSYSDRSIKLGTKYTYFIRAYDSSGNVSSRSNLVSVTIKSGSPKKKLGDINGDGRINIRDLSILLFRWRTNYASADLNGDGKVDIRDLSVLLSRWGR